MSQKAELETNIHTCRQFTWELTWGRSKEWQSGTRNQGRRKANIRTHYHLGPYYGLTVAWSSLNFPKSLLQCHVSELPILLQKGKDLSIDSHLSVIKGGAHIPELCTHESPAVFCAISHIGIREAPSKKEEMLLQQKSAYNPVWDLPEQQQLEQEVRLRGPVLHKAYIATRVLGECQT